MRGNGMVQGDIRVSSAGSSGSFQGEMVWSDPPVALCFVAFYLQKSTYSEKILLSSFDYAPTYEDIQ